MAAWQHRGKLASCLLLVCANAAADKTDIVEFGSSRMVGEVKHLDRGKLYFKTDSTGTIEIDWVDVTKLVTKQTLRIEHRDGRVSVGSIASAREPSALTQPDENTGQESDSFADIAAFEPLEDGFWQRLDISTSLGYSFAKSTGVENFNFATEFGYNSEKRSRDLSLSSQISASDNADRSVRNAADYQSLRFSGSRYFTGWRASYEANDALGLDYRVLGAWLAGREFYPRTNGRVRAFAGIDLSEESSTDVGSNFGSELVLGGSIDWYKFKSPELDLSSTLIIYPSITRWGRVRSNLDITLRWEIYEDLFWELSFYDDYDNESSDPNSADGASTNDFGITTSLGWTW